MSERLTQLDILRFAYGEADELEAVIFDDPDYLEQLEEIWASEMPRDLTGPLVQMARAQATVSDTLGLVIDVAVAFGKAIPHYLEADASGEEEDERDS